MSNSLASHGCLSGSSIHGFSRQDFWSGLPFPSPSDLPDPGIESRSPGLQADTLLSEPPGKLFLGEGGINTDQCEKENKNAHSPAVHTVLVGLKKFHVHGWKFKPIKQKSPLLAWVSQQNTIDWWLKRQKLIFSSPGSRCPQV